MTTAQQVLDIARAEIGITESPPGSNRQKYGAAFGLNGVAWCAEFEWWVFAQAGMVLPKKTAGVYDLMNAFKAAGRFWGTPVVGDVVIFSYGDGHTGILESFSDTTITTIDGNTGNDSISNGGAVMRRTRPRYTHVLGYGRPAYDTASQSPATQSTNTTPAEEDVNNDSAYCVTWPDGSKTKVTEDGSILNLGSPYMGSLGDVAPENKLSFQRAIGLTAVNPLHPEAGYRIWAQNGDKYEFTPAFKKQV